MKLRTIVKTQNYKTVQENIGKVLSHVGLEMDDLGKTSNEQTSITDMIVSYHEHIVTT